MEIINKRRSVRTYKEIKVEKEKIELLLKAGMQAPSAKNQAPWVFLVIEDKETIEKLSEISSPLKVAPLAIVLFTDTRILKNTNLYSSDMGAASQNILLEAVELGLGGCWIGLDNSLKRIELLNNVIEYPEYLKPFSILTIGYPEDDNANCFIDRYNKERVFYGKF